MRGVREGGGVRGGGRRQPRQHQKGARKGNGAAPPPPPDAAGRPHRECTTVERVTQVRRGCSDVPRPTRLAGRAPRVRAHRRAYRRRGPYRRRRRHSQQPRGSPQTPWSVRRWRGARFPHAEGGRRSGGWWKGGSGRGLASGRSLTAVPRGGDSTSAGRRGGAFHNAWPHGTPSLPTVTDGQHKSAQTNGWSAQQSEANHIDRAPDPHRIQPTSSAGSSAEKKLRVGCPRQPVELANPTPWPCVHLAHTVHVAGAHTLHGPTTPVGGRSKSTERKVGRPLQPVALVPHYPRP